MKVILKLNIGIEILKAKEIFVFPLLHNEKLLGSNTNTKYSWLLQKFKKII